MPVHTFNIAQRQMYKHLFRVAKPPKKYADLVPVDDGFQGGGLKGNLDIDKMVEFFAGSLLPVEKMRSIRNRTTKSRFRTAITDDEVRRAFETYCSQLDAKNVVYHYNANGSPFATDYKGVSNCKGRATGFLQLMAVLGVPADQLNFCEIGSVAGEKVCQKAAGDIVPEAVYRIPRDPVFAPNAVRIELNQAGKPVVSRTEREPFAFHYCAYLSVPSLGFKYWDPLERVAYRNGFDDFFTSYESDDALLNDLQEWKTIGVKCFANPSNKDERLYYLPPSSKLRAKMGYRSLLHTGGLGSKAAAGLDLYFNQPAYKQVESGLRRMSVEGEEASVAVIIDWSDWGVETLNHPPVIGAMFRN